MLERFFAFEVDEEGQELPSELKLNRLLFEHGSVALDDLKRTKMRIARNESLMNAHMGQYLVIRLDLKKVQGEDYEELVQLLRAHMVEIYETFPYLKTSIALSESQRKKYQDFYVSPCANHSRSQNIVIRPSNFSAFSLQEVKKDSYFDRRIRFAYQSIVSQV